MQGKIVKGISGFYYVHVVGTGIYECKAKGAVRKQKMKPLVGDNAEIVPIDEEGRIGNVVEILERKNELIRPAVANIDQALIIFAMSKPEPNYNLLDRFLLMMKKQGLDCIICFNKRDIATKQERENIQKIYENSGCRVIFASALKKEGIDEIINILDGKTTAVAGPSGVGKSSIVNCLQRQIKMETGAISEKIEEDYENFTTLTSEEISSIADDVLGILDTATLAVSALAIIVGAIGIINTMVMAVYERTKEIGVLKSVGWKSRKILTMILGETLVLTTLSGIVGSIFGILIPEVGLRLFNVTDFALGYSPKTFILAFGITIIVGIIGGIYPAYKASKLAPTEALRYE